VAKVQQKAVEPWVGGRADGIKKMLKVSKVENAKKRNEGVTPLE
jgi:hypothetical protein